MASKNVNRKDDYLLQEDTLHTYENVQAIELEVTTDEEEYRIQCEEDEYVVPNDDHESDLENHVMMQQKNNKKQSDGTNSKIENNKYGHHNIYLQQIPNQNKCKVQCSVDGLYENDGETIVDQQDGKVNKNAMSSKYKFRFVSCLKSAICSKIICVILGFILIGLPITGIMIAGFYTSEKERPEGNNTVRNIKYVQFVLTNVHIKNYKPFINNFQLLPIDPTTTTTVATAKAKTIIAGNLVLP